MQRDAWFFVAIFAFIFIVWIISGGPVRSLRFSIPPLPDITATKASTTTTGRPLIGLPQAPYSIGTSMISLPGSTGSGSSPAGSSGGTSGTSPLPPIKGVEFGPPSPYRGIVTMGHYVAGAGSSNPDNEYVQISVHQNGVPVDLTGWTLESETTGTASVIPKGTEVPLSGVVNEVQDIVLEPGDRAYVISGRSPIGASFKENKCIGYFAQFQHFSPSLPLTCPTPASELQANYSGYIRDAACIDYVNSVGRCKAVLSPPTTVSGACQTFLVKYLNYNGCVAAHRNDKDFGGTTWHVYLGRTNSMFRKTHEVVKLLDKNGKTVDAFSY